MPVRGPAVHEVFDASSSGSPTAAMFDGELDEKHRQHEGHDRQLEPDDVLGPVPPAPGRPGTLVNAHRQYVVTVTDIASIRRLRKTLSGKRRAWHGAIFPRSSMTDCSTLRLPATTNKNSTTPPMRNHGERPTWVAAPR